MPLELTQLRLRRFPKAALGTDFDNFNKVIMNLLKENVKEEACLLA